ncbi:hypothetical protein OG21DRAFT_1523965 [Imleria badia]|nr:hypothetical protein OG21DRAFT_1523965 [Imleria badia]
MAVNAYAIGTARTSQSNTAEFSPGKRGITSRWEMDVCHDYDAVVVTCSLAWLKRFILDDRFEIVSTPVNGTVNGIEVHYQRSGTRLGYVTHKRWERWAAVDTTFGSVPSPPEDRDATLEFGHGVHPSKFELVRKRNRRQLWKSTKPHNPRAQRMRGTPSRKIKNKYSIELREASVHM